nr:retrovirus-related Pol polyprotein from transposon TNT 1-94 [Tanacetum cinerariifolium]
MRQFSVARTPQQNGVAKRRNMTLIEVARTMLADSKLPITFWAEAVNTASYVQNRVLVVKPHNKTSYELFHGRTPSLSFMRPFGCRVIILNTNDHLGKFDGKADEGFFVGYSLNSKAFRVFNSRTRIVEENLHVTFSKNTPNVVGTQSNGFTGKKQVIMQSSQNDGFKPLSDDGKKVDEDLSKGNKCYDQEKEDNVNNTNNVNIVSSIVNAAGTNGVNVVGEFLFDPDMPALEDVGTFDFSNEDEDDDAVANMNNLDTTIQVLNGILGIKRTMGIMIRNKAKLVAQGHTQEEGIDYDEVFGLVARIKAIRLFLAYASFKNFVVYQMDVKSAFLYGKIEEEVYVWQPPGFEDPNFLAKVYKCKKQIVVANSIIEAEYVAASSCCGQLIEECSIEICEKQKQSMEDTMLDALNSKLLLINSNSQHLDKKEQEVKNVVEQPAERRNRSIQSLQNFRVVHKSSISSNTSQISSIHSIAPILSTKDLEHLLSMGYEHLSITPEKEVTKSNAENFLPILKTRSGTHANNSLPEYDSFCFKIEPDQEKLINLVENDILDNSSNDSLLEEVDLFLSDNSIPPGIENVADDPEGDIRFLEELLIDDSILSHESSDFNFEDNSLISRPPPEPPDAETDAGEEI